MSSTQPAAAAGTTDDNLSRQLQEWTQTSFTDLYNLDKDPQTQTLFASDAQITVNGDVLSLEKYDEHIREQRGGATRVDILWENVLANPEDESVRSVLFKGSYTITRSLRFRLRAAPMQTSTHVVLEARVVEVNSERKIASLLQTETYDRTPVHLTPVPAGSVSSQGDTSEVEGSQGS
ncbi:hypothetical protein BJY52DRAFT_1293819 [Lactarius psammicola]|nr:hypothetical protein BJY52DRAFT_1293819 [Lactarius psammicola]